MVFLALDQGTTSSRAIVFGPGGEVLGQARHEIAQHYPQPGWVEHDPEEIFDTQWRAAREAHQAAGKPEVGGVGITNQRETVVVFDTSTGEPIHRAIVWQDRRTADCLAAMREHEDRVRELTGLPLDPYFSASKIAWILDAVPGARDRAERGELFAGTIDAWLLWKLTGGQVFATEPSNASRTMLFDLGTGDWSDELCALLRVPRACLPEIRPSAGDFGQVAATGWPVTGILGDQQAALFGQGCFDAGEAKCTYGTGAFLLMNCGTRIPAPGKGILGTVAWRLGETTTYALEGSVLVSGALIQWLGEGLGLFDSLADVENLARSVEDAGDLVIVPAFAGLGTPHWDADARGLMIGITRGTGPGQIARAALQAMALQVREVQLAMEETMGSRFSNLRVDGGAAANDLLLGIQASLCGIEVHRPASLEATAVGGFRMAMLGAKEAATPSELAPMATEVSVFPPGDHDVEGLWERWCEAVQRSRGWANPAR
jgi:glycerol kinase